MIFLVMTLAVLSAMCHAHDACKGVCKQVAKQMEKGLERTSGRKEPVTVGGGRTIPYERSEARLTDILKGVCRGADNAVECNEFIAKEEEKISKWYYSNPRGDFEQAVCTCKSGQKKRDGDQKSKKCAFCPCSWIGCCEGDWKKCVFKTARHIKQAGQHYGGIAVHEAWKYGKLANKKLDTLPITNVTRKLPIRSDQRRFVEENWKAIVLTLLLLVLTPVYYLSCKCGSAPAQLRRGGRSSVQGRQDSRSRPRN